jgi:uncharacterized membrane protein YgcG
MIIFQKLANIDHNSHQTYLKSMKPQYKIKRSQKDSQIINGIRSLAQENLFILKRLITQESEYSAEKFMKKYKESRKYKNNICHYPSINFYRTKTDTKPLIQTYELSPKKNKLPKINELSKRNFMTLQSKYSKYELDPHYFKEAKRAKKNNTMTNTKRINNNNNKKETMKIVTENEDESSNSNSHKKKSDEGQSGSNEGSQNEDDYDGGGSSSGSGSGSGSGDEKE